MTDVDLTAHLRTITETAQRFLIKDLNALDENHAAGSPNEALRPAIKIVAECGAVNQAIATLLATGVAASPSPEQREAFFAGITTRAEALAALDEGTQKLLAAISEVGADRWGETVTGFFGPATLLATASFAAQHMMYHDGQLNHFHLIHGDTEMHWR